MDVDWRRTARASAWGAAAFCAGLVVAYVAAPAGLLGGSATGPRTAALLYLSANGVPVAVPPAGGGGGSSTVANLLRVDGGLAHIRAVPPVVIALGAALAVRDARDGSEAWTFRATAGTALAVVPGYLLCGLLVLRASGARPAIAPYVEIFLLVGVAFTVGAAALRPFFESAPVVLVALLWSAVVMGIMALLLTALAIADATAGMLVVSTGTALATGLVLWLAGRVAGASRGLAAGGEGPQE